MCVFVLTATGPVVVRVLLRMPLQSALEAALPELGEPRIAQVVVGT